LGYAEYNHIAGKYTAKRITETKVKPVSFVLKRDRLTTAVYTK